MRKTIAYKVIDNTIIDALLTTSLEKNLIVDSYEGCLLDKSIIYNDNTISINSYIRDYIIIDTIYINCWTSQYKIIITDNIELVEEFINKNDSCIA